MISRKKLTLFNDPIYGFITIPNRLVFELIEHPYFQRLRRITQMGMSYLVYPGAHHTRFHHAIGCMHLMQKAVQVLRFKGVAISPEEEEALYVAILLHDIGHGPFSHALEHSIVNNTNHERISLLFMEQMNQNFNQRLTLGIQIFSNTYSRKFLHQLVSGQLDMDRLDYLKRDSFYTGATEGNINSERLISMLEVVDDKLVLEAKAIYSIEKFIIARRLMYWSVYLHKTSLVAEQVLMRILQRAKLLISQGQDLPASPALHYFLSNNVTDFDTKALKQFALLDDNDIIQALKLWRTSSDVVLNKLCGMILDRRLLKIKIKKQPIKQSQIEKQLLAVQQNLGLAPNEAKYFVFGGHISNQAYNNTEQKINLVSKSGKLVDLAQASDQLNIKALSKQVDKYFLCYPKLK